MTFECVECFSEAQKVDEQGRCESCGGTELGSGTHGHFGGDRSDGGGQGESVGGGDRAVAVGDGGMVVLRRDRGLTQQQLADELGVSVRTISRWETGKATPSKMALKILRSEGL